MEPKKKINIILLSFLIVQIIIILGIVITTYLLPKPKQNNCAIATCNLDNYETYDQNGVSYIKFLDCKITQKNQIIWQGTCSGYLKDND